MKRIKIASGDTGHRLYFQLMDRENDRPLDLSPDGTAISFHFLMAEVEVFHLSAVVIESCLGLVSVDWPPVGLLTPGLYDGIFRVVFENQKAITIPETIPFEITAALPCVSRIGNPIHSPARWDARNGRWLLANADHPNVWHEVTIRGDPNNPTIDIGDGEILDGETI